ncbi:MAG: IclR family transcriptional regulator [Desulfobacterales bacterium]|jgi:DNA-binding IclR family transcriptional regulator
MKPTSTHQSLKRGLQIVEMVAEMAEPPTLSAIARKSKLNRSTTHHILKALVEFGYLVQAPKTHVYSLSSKLFRLTRRTWPTEQLAEIATPYLEELGSLTKEGTSLAVFRNGRVIIAARQEQDGPLRVVQRIGESRPVYCTAVGKVLAAGLSEQDLEELIERTDFQRKTPKTITSPVGFRKEMARVRKRGLAFDNEEHIKGVRCLAAPIRDYSGETRAALCVVGPKDNLSPKRMAKLQHSLLGTATALSARLGFKPEKSS